MAQIVTLRPAGALQTGARERATAPSWIARWRERIALRRMLRDELLREPDSVLADAGWTRAEVLREIRKPPWRA